MDIKDRQSEMQVIGCLMKNPFLLAEIDHYHFDTRDFSSKLTRYVFSAINNLFLDGAKQIGVIDIDNYLNFYINLKKDFEDCNGITYLQDCELLCNLENFDYYYKRLKKISAIRSLHEDGFDISEFYCVDPVNPELLYFTQKFDEIEISDIFESIKKKLYVLEDNYTIGQNGENGEVCKGLKDYKEKLKRTPELGSPLQGKYFNTVVRGARKGKYYLRSAGSGTGKAIPNDTLIPTPIGWRKVSSIQVGDSLFSQEGTPTKVLGVFPQGKKQEFVVSFESGRSAKCCNEHLWEIIIDNNVYVLPLSTISTIKKDKYVRITKPVKNCCIKSLQINEAISIDSRLEIIKPLLLLGSVKNGYYYINDNSEALVEILESLGSLVYRDNSGVSIKFHLDISHKLLELGIDSYSCIHNGLEKITDIKNNSDLVEMTCFSVDNKDQLFLINDYIVTHNTRMAVGDACNLSMPEKYDWKLKKWLKKDYTEKVLFITTELDMEEIQSLVLSWVSGVNEEKILLGTYTQEEEAVVDKAIEIIEKYSENFVIEQISDPSIGKIESSIRKYVLTKNIQNVFYDYIFSSPSLLNEFASLKIREDVILRMLSTALKDLAVELKIFLVSATQVSGDPTEKKGIRGPEFIRGARAIADKGDASYITCLITEEELKILQPTITSLGLPTPNTVTDVWKSRRGKHKNVRIWSCVDLGTCRVEDVLITDAFFNPIPNFETIVYQDEYYYKQKNEEVNTTESRAMDLSIKQKKEKNIDILQELRGLS